MTQPEFQGNETGPYEDPRDNFYYHNHLNPALQYVAWITQWKKQHWEIHKDCQKLGLTDHTDEYVRGFLDAVSYQPHFYTP